MTNAWRTRVGDPARLAALARTQLLDSASEEAFDRLTRLSGELLRAPVALVSLVDHERQFFKSAVGLDEPWASARQAPLTHSFCKHVVASGSSLVVEDARQHGALRDEPAWSELGVIAYAGVPIAFDGHAIGALCVIDHEPHPWTPDDLRVLRTLADAVEGQVVLGRMSKELAERERVLQAVLATMPAGVVLRRVDGSVMHTNPALERMLGRSAAELATADFWDLTHPDDVEGDKQSREELLAGQRKVGTRVKRYRHADGHYIWVRLSAAVLHGEEQQMEGTIAVIDDISLERQAEEGVGRQARMFEVTIANLSDGVVVLNGNNDALYANRAYAEIFGLDADKAVGLSRRSFLEHAERLAADPVAFRNVIESATPTSPDAKAELTLARPHPRHLRRTVVAADLPTGPGRVVIWQDISAERELLAEREKQAFLDALTGIPNRRAAEEELAKAFARADRAQTPVSLALFDVDHFKGVNDRHGHAAGDEVLRRIAAALDARKRLTDTVARWGGEEFVAVLPVSLDGAVVFCERVRSEVGTLRFSDVGNVTISAGVAERQTGETPEAVLRRADERLYRAKAAGRNRVRAS